PHSLRTFSINDTATTEIYTLSLHDALPIWMKRECREYGMLKETGPIIASAHMSQFVTKNLFGFRSFHLLCGQQYDRMKETKDERSEEHTSELQSRFDLVCRLLLEKKKNKTI